MKKRYIKLSILLIFIIILDQISKYLVETNMYVGESITMIPKFFYITFVLNSGAAWSILEGKMIFFYLISIVAILLLGYYLTTLKEPYQYISRIGVVLMIAGTLGNFIDRLCFSCVRDFLDFVIIGYDFPVFNIADMALCIGVACIIIDELVNDFGVRKKWKKDN